MLFYGLTKSDIANIDAEKLINVLIKHGFTEDSMMHDKRLPLRYRDEYHEFEKRYGHTCVTRMTFDYGKFEVGGHTGVEPFDAMMQKDLPILKKAILELESIFKEDIFKKGGEHEKSF